MYSLLKVHAVTLNIPNKPEEVTPMIIIYNVILAHLICSTISGV